MSRLPLAALIAMLALGACTEREGAYPSLARRPAERISGTSQVVSPTPVAPPVPGPSNTALGALVSRAEEAHQRFVARTARARGLVSAAAGAAVASENWSVATVALADLESARSEAMIALADLDALYAAQRIEGGDAAATGAARERVTALVAEEDGVLADLRGRVRS